MFSNTISFDAHILQLMPPLTLGAKLVIAKPKGHMDPDYMVDLIQSAGITSMVFTVPTLVRRQFIRLTFLCYLFMHHKLLHFIFDRLLSIWHRLLWRLPTPR